MGNALQQATEYLAKQAAIVNHELLPYALQVVFMAVAFARLQEKDPVEKKTLIHWFWRTSWSEAFASPSYRQIKAELESLYNPDKVVWERARDIPLKFDLRSARVRLMILRLALRPDWIDAEGELVNGRAILTTHGRNAFVQLFRPSAKIDHSLRPLFQGAGNRFLINPASASDLRHRLLHGPELPDKALHALFVDQEALLALRRGDYEKFLLHRATKIDQWDQSEWQAVQPQSPAITIPQ